MGIVLLYFGWAVMLGAATGLAENKLPSTTPYTLLVSFSSEDFQHFDSLKVEELNKSPYHGVAIPLISAYDDQKHASEEFQPTVERLKQTLKASAWPWIFWNRLVGTSSETLGRFPEHPSNKPYFKAIKGMDIFNETGALNDFYHLYEQALSIAKELHAPGIVIDLEVYNNYDLYDISALAGLLQKPPLLIEQQLQSIGKKLTDMANTLYPEATLWFFFTALGENSDPHQTRTITHVASGMLERAKEIHSKLKIVTGGEVSLGYCSLSETDLMQRLKARAERLQPIQSRYPNLELGGTIAPWDGSKPRTGWLTEDRCGKSSAQNLEDFAQLFKTLLQTYDYVWIYAASEAPYEPFSAGAGAYNETLLQAQPSALQMQTVSSQQPPTSK